ncbi:hypothetical protein TVAG_142610 [Trichomonas vaginalis G3]|uniref:Uncharacterized protein n=1 Tax=Trichomonas vaginalis (strain ATCC PRA-98 / G3) TaxID=412133 RepID=A2FTI7_TRIV3|nr:hypothetical protein TVAGG3_0877760 [Trichomonas vaginalis G3]EAX91777.1 hypothetical protein TVAG_142610 [Trichomonas vaginalis G3]KAI5501815.1 hypothetical protein TVAGG3_0877760 [Trichomonas vaginalis G3]|eukprot:XP_001304707.1 hypothetical protein [Trichomonas vaginalis G3]
MTENFTKISLTRDIQTKDIHQNTIQVIFPDFTYELPLKIALQFRKFQYLLRSDPLIKSIKIDKQVQKFTLEQDLNLLESLNQKSFLLQDLFDDQNSSKTHVFAKEIKDITVEQCIECLSDKNSKDYQASIQFAALHIEDVYHSLLESNISPKTIIKIFNSSIRVSSEEKLFNIVYSLINALGEPVSHILLSIQPEFLTKSTFVTYGNLIKKYDLISSPEIMEKLLALPKLQQKPSSLSYRYLVQLPNSKIEYNPSHPNKGILFTYRDYAKVYSSSGLFETQDYPHPACIINHEDDKVFVSDAALDQFVTVMFTNIKVDVTDYYIKTGFTYQLPFSFSFQCSKDGKTYDTVDEQMVSEMVPNKIYQFHLKQKYEGASTFRWKMNGPNSNDDLIFTFNAVEVFGSVEILKNEIDLLQI